MQELYKILEDMVKSANQDNREEVLKLNDSFEELFHKVYPSPINDLGMLYDNCRQSCVLAERMPNMRDKFLEYLKQEFSKIPKPE